MSGLQWYGNFWTEWRFGGKRISWDIKNRSLNFSICLITVVCLSIPAWSLSPAHEGAGLELRAHLSCLFTVIQERHVEVQDQLGLSTALKFNCSPLR